MICCFYEYKYNEKEQYTHISRFSSKKSPPELRPYSAMAVLVLLYIILFILILTTSFVVDNAYL